MIILQNLITTYHRKSGKSKDDLKLTELDVVTMRIRYRVNGVSDPVRTMPAEFENGTKLLRLGVAFTQYIPA